MVLEHDLAAWPADLVDQVVAHELGHWRLGHGARRLPLTLLAELQDDLGIAYLFISHDLSVVRSFCDDIAVMYRGRIVEQGTAREVVLDPAHPYTRSLLDAAPIPDPALQRGRSLRVERYRA